MFIDIPKADAIFMKVQMHRSLICIFSCILKNIITQRIWQSNMIAKNNENASNFIF